ncbi:MAG: helix-turn-helix transcriptional regulator [Lachnospiraceae bacterium]|nr:helix-turn-helix transcriptional regulator [Lachnospiraceae bacterium]
MDKKKSVLLSNYKKATVEMLLLKMLSEADMYGYQLAQELKKRSNGEYTLQEGSMYPILYRLSDQNRITSYEKRVGTRLTRIYYHLEPAGLDYYYELLDDYNSYTNLIQSLLSSNAGESLKED